MRSCIRPLVSTFLVAALLVVSASCASDDSLTGPSTPQASTAPAPSALLEPILGSTLQTVLGTLQLLTCSTQPYAQTTVVVGPAGGTITVGAHKLVIPAGALSARVTITAEQVSGTVNSVRFKPDGLQFAKPATLTLSYGNCLLSPLRKQVVYTDERLRILDVMSSLDLWPSKSVSGVINHFSRYAVAY
jgi:hypothetical protein